MDRFDDALLLALKVKAGRQPLELEETRGQVLLQSPEARQIS